MADTVGTLRASAILRMKQALKEGMSANAFIRQLIDEGKSYRRQTMLADWRSVANVEEKTGRLKYVRKDYTPTASVTADVTWQTSREFMYKLRVQTRKGVGLPIEERFVNIMSDRPMTPRELETEVTKSWGGWYPERRDELVATIPETAIRRVAT